MAPVSGGEPDAGAWDNPAIPARSVDRQTLRQNLALAEPVHRASTMAANEP